VGAHGAVLLLLLARFVDAGLLAARQIHEVEYCGLGVLTICKKVHIQAVKRVRARGMMVHFGLGVSSVLLAQLEQLQALVKRLHNNFDQAFDGEALALVLRDLQGLLEPVLRLIEQVVQLVIVDFEVAAREGDSLLLAADELDLGEQIRQRVNQDSLVACTSLLRSSGRHNQIVGAEGALDAILLNAALLVVLAQLHLQLVVKIALDV
jgi:hypothetical protein